MLDIMANHRSVSNIQMLYAFGDSMFGQKKEDANGDKSQASASSLKWINRDLNFVNKSKK